MEHESTLHAPSHFFPVLLVKVEPGVPTRTVEHLGTGFFLFPDTLITCWHCVADAPPPGHKYAIRVEVARDQHMAYFLHDIQRDINGTDVATARCPYAPPVQLELRTKDLLLGEEVWTFGYPFPERKRGDNGELWHVINGRFLRGYVTRQFYYDHPDLGKTGAYELDMRAPQGVSGAPLLRRGTIQVAGLVFGSIDVETIEEFASIDPATGTRQSEVRRITSFALSYDTKSLCALTTTATNNMPLERFLQQSKSS